MKILLMFLIGLISNPFFCQTELVHGNNGRVYKVYTSLNSADSVNSDSVFAISLTGKFVDIPKHILRYKNLKYLYLGSTISIKDKPKKKLTKKMKEKQKLDSIISRYSSCTKTTSDKPKYNECYVIKDIPEWIGQLKNLEEVFLMTAKIKNINNYKKIFNYLPNVYIRPDTFDLNNFYYKGTYGGAKCCE